MDERDKIDKYVHFLVNINWIEKLNIRLLNINLLLIILLKNIHFYRIILLNINSLIINKIKM
jgi:hypothetical protein